MEFYYSSYSKYESERVVRERWGETPPETADYFADRSKILKSLMNKLSWIFYFINQKLKIYNKILLDNREINIYVKCAFMKKNTMISYEIFEKYFHQRIIENNTLGFNNKEPCRSYR